MFTDSFSYPARPMRVVFGQGLQPLREQMWELGVSRAVVISAPDRTASARKVADTIGSAVIDVLAEAVMHVPVAAVDHSGRRCRNLGCDYYIAVGGGSATGLTKETPVILRTSGISEAPRIHGHELMSVSRHDSQLLASIANTSKPSPNNSTPTTASAAKSGLN